MASFLIDTHVFIWWITGGEKLSKAARDCITNPEHTIIVSAISAWEISIKASLGRLSEIGDPESSVAFHAQRSGFSTQAFPFEAGLKVFHLPNHHSDPFDRALIAHAQTLGAPIITADKLIPQYDIETLW